MKGVWLKKCIAFLAAAICMFSLGTAALAAGDSTEVVLPVSASGVDCTATLLDKNGATVQTLPLKAGETGNFVFIVTGLGSHNYTVRLADEDSYKATFDKTVYTVKIVVSSVGGKIYATIEVFRDGVEDKYGDISFVNKPLVDPERYVIADPPIQKKIAGDSPNTDALFRFRMSAVSNSLGLPLSEMPMPAGAVDGIITVDVYGPGEYEFGDMYYYFPGVFVYRIEEVDTEQEGYTYDTNGYTQTVTVEEVDGVLTLISVIRTDDSRETPKAVFTNIFEKSPIQDMNRDPEGPENPNKRGEARTARKPEMKHSLSCG